MTCLEGNLQVGGPDYAGLNIQWTVAMEVYAPDELDSLHFST